MSLVSMGEVRQAVGASDPSRDAELHALRDAIVAQWEEETGRLWVRREDHEERWQIGGRRAVVWARLFPVESIAIEEGSPGEDLAELEAEEFDADLESGRIERIGSNWGRKVVLTITGGHTPATAPADVKAAILTQIAFSLARNRGASIAVTSQSISSEAQATFMAAGVHPVFRQAVERHRWRVVV